MTPALWPLVGFAAWTILLVLGVITTRSVLVLKGDKRVNEFPAGTPHGADWYWRLSRAQVNAAENLPIFATLVLVAHVAGVRTHAVALVAHAILFARIAQSVFHVASVNDVLGYLRFGAFLVQLAGYVALIVQIATYAG